MEREWKKTGCPFCSLNCALEVVVENDQIVDVRPNPESTKEPGGYCCRKGRSVMYYQNNPERLDYPLKRVGDHFERISWEQAYKEIGEKAKALLDKYGPRVFAFCGFGTASSCEEGVAQQGMMAAIGTQYSYSPVGFEFMCLYWTYGRILGNQNIYTEIDDKNVDTVIYWGSNAYVANHFVPAHRTYIRNMSENENKTVVVVDPRLSETARMADFHIMPRNGSDALFIRGLIALILDKGWEDKEFLQKFASDWDEASKWYVGFDYRSTFEVSGVPYDVAERFARLLTTTTWGCHAELGMICGRHNTMNCFMLLSLMAVTGNLLVKGNVTIDGPIRGGPTPDEQDPNSWRTVETDAFKVAISYPVGVFAKEALSKREDRHRAVFMSKTNPARSYPDSNEVEGALENLDLLVVCDLAMTDTAKHAHYVLPGKSGFEQYEFSYFPLTYPEVVWLYRQPVIGQIAERKSMSEIMLGVAKAMGLVPEIPENLIQAAAKTCREKKGLPIFMMKFMIWFGKQKDYQDSMLLILLDIFSRPECMGSTSRASARLLLATDHLIKLGVPQRGGYKHKGIYKLMAKVPQMQQLTDMELMDQVYWDAEANKNGHIIGYSNPDPEQRARDHIFHPDKKIRLYNDVISDHIGNFTPEKMREDLALTEEFDMVCSSGNHKDSGVDNYMRNPDTYRFRDPYVLTMNPEDAKEKGIREGDKVRVVSVAGELIAPVEFSYMVNRKYCMIPHHFGHTSTRYGTYGMSASLIVSSENLDEITGDPAVRYEPCRIEKI